MSTYASILARGPDDFNRVLNSPLPHYLEFRSPMRTKWPNMDGGKLHLDFYKPLTETLHFLRLSMLATATVVLAGPLSWHQQNHTYFYITL